MLAPLADREQMEHELAGRDSPVLADGTRLRDLIDFDRREVSLRVFNDAEIHRMELVKVFGRSWTVVGHATEIPNAGDFVKRYIGQDQVVVVRGRDGDIHVLLNACSHRGMEICWAEDGNQASFKCPYHGWVFDHSGNLLGAPFEKEMYGDWDKSQYGLKTARVGQKHGIIFATFRDEAPSLDDYLGDIGWYLDHMYGGVELEALGSPGRFAVNANWKVICDNNSGDGYHTPSLHHSMEEIGFMPKGAKDSKSWALDGCYDLSTPQGHGLRCVETNQAVFRQGDLADKERPFEGWFLAGNLFPANGVHSTPSPAADGKILQTADIMVTIPRGPGVVEVWRLPLIDKAASEAAKRAMVDKFCIQVTTLQTDDYVGFEAVQRPTHGVIGQEQTTKYNALLDVRKPADWPGPGLVYAGFSKDDNQWRFWLAWYDLMTR